MMKTTAFTLQESDVIANKKRYLLKWKQYIPCSRARNKAVLPLRKTADHSGSYLYSHIDTAVYTVLDITYYS